MEEKFANEHDIKLGDQITLEHDGMLTSDTFSVTAIINEPFFCCATVRDARGKSSEGLGSASYYIMLTADAFDSSYYKDNIVLTLMGLILGSGFGIVLSYVVVRIIETGANRYVRTPNIPACLYACAVGALFALIVNLIALRKIKHLNLTNVSGN